MKVSPIVTASSNPQHTPTQDAQDKRAKAMAAFMGGPASGVVGSQNAVAVEELGALQTPSSKAPDRQETTSEVQTQDTGAVVEPTAQSPQTPPAKDPELSRQFAQLARQEKQLRAKAVQQDQALKAREAALVQREEALAKVNQFDPTKYVERERLRAETLDVLAEEQISYDELTQRALNHQPMSPQVKSYLQKLELEVKALKQANESSQKTYTEGQKQAYDAAVVQIKRDVKHLVTSDPAFETIKATNSHQDVVDLITQTYEKDGILLTNEEAAKEVEDYLVEEAMKLTQIEKIKSRMVANAKAAVPAPEAQKQAPATLNQAQTPAKTLTNAIGTQRKMTTRERAIARFNGEKF